MSADSPLPIWMFVCKHKQQRRKHARLETNGAGRGRAGRPPSANLDKTSGRHALLEEQGGGVSFCKHKYQ